MDTLLYDLSIPAISSLQAAMPSQAPTMQLLSTVFDPKYAFLVYSPLAYLLDPKVGRKLIMTTVLAEWINMILKWLLHGERPYWYVHSSGHHDPQATPIKQFPSTCELGPGHPSGHAMVTAAVWYVILSSLLEAYQKYQAGQADSAARHRNSRTVQASTWVLYSSLLALVSVSRVFLGCHFPHQCLAGAALGLLVAKWVSRQQIEPRHYVGASVLLLATAFGTFALLQAAGLDPSWTIRLATKHCVKRDYIHLDTAPFFSIMRYCGFALGAGLGLMFPLAASSVVALRGRLATEQLVSSETAEDLVAEFGTTTTKAQAVTSEDEELAKPNALSSRNISWFSFKLLMALLMARLVDNLGLFVSHANLSTFYAAAFVAYTLFSYAFVNL